MTCAACAARVEKKLAAIDGVVAAVNFATEKAVITAPTSVPAERLIDAVEQAGYGAELTGPAAGAEGAGRERSGGGSRDAARVAYLRRRLIVALVGNSVRLRRFAAPAAGPPGSPRPRPAAPPQAIASAREGAPHGQVT